MENPDTCTIQGKIVVMQDGKKIPPYDVEIRQFKDKKLILMTIPDTIGNFIIRHIPKNSGQYEIDFVLEDFDTVKVKVMVNNQDVNLGTIVVE